MRKLQAALTAVGYGTRGVDGDFGRNTENAVKRFEADMGVAEDGVAWPGLQKALYGLAGAREKADALAREAAESLALFGEKAAFFQNLLADMTNRVS